MMIRPIEICSGVENRRVLTLNGKLNLLMTYCVGVHLNPPQSRTLCFPSSAPPHRQNLQPSLNP
jgi:hypothetical protein